MPDTKRIPELTCEVCGDEPGVGVASIPGVPMSVAYGKRCLAANAHPYGIVVANTAMASGHPDWEQGCAPWWKQIVHDTLAHLGKTREEFDADVAREVEVMREYEAEMERVSKELNEELESGDTELEPGS